MQYFTVKFCTIPYSIGKKFNVFNLFTLNSIDITTPNQAYVVRDSLHGPCSVQYYTGIYHRTDKQQVEPMRCKNPCSMQYVTGSFETTLWYGCNNEERFSTLHSTYYFKTTTENNGVRDHQPLNGP